MISSLKLIHHLNLLLNDDFSFGTGLWGIFQGFELSKGNMWVRAGRVPKHDTMIHVNIPAIVTSCARFIYVYIHISIVGQHPWQFLMWPFYTFSGWLGDPNSKVGMVTSKKINLDRVRFREPIARGLPFSKWFHQIPRTLTPGSALFQLGGLPVLASPGWIVDLGDGGWNDSWSNCHRC